MALCEISTHTAVSQTRLNGQTCGRCLRINKQALALVLLVLLPACVMLCCPNDSRAARHINSTAVSTQTICCFDIPLPRLKQPASLVPDPLLGLHPACHYTAIPKPNLPNSAASHSLPLLCLVTRHVGSLHCPCGAC